MGVVDTLVVEGGALGPVPACRLDFRPLTVLVGPQGTGKSLLAQLPFHVRELGFLAQVVAGSLDRALIDQALRGRRRELVNRHGVDVVLVPVAKSGPEAHVTLDLVELLDAIGA